MTDVIVVLEIIGYIQRITKHIRSIMPFIKVLHQKVFTMSFKTHKVSREKRRKPSTHSRTLQRQI